MNHRDAKRRRPPYPASSSGLVLQVRDNNNRNDEATSAAPAVAPAEDESLLLRLSECCHRHQVSHHSKKDSASAAVWCQEDEEQVPDGCREAIDMLRKILPKVELKSMSIHREPGQKRGPPARDVAHMCDFYTSALNGVFCPHAPHLFLLGKGGTESKCDVR
jgi:hypothetical protein